MKIQEIMERTGIIQTGRAIAYIKDALDEMNLLSEIHTKRVRLDIEVNKRFYNLPNEAVKVLDIRCKNHNNNSNKYQSIPRSIYEPETEDADGV
jgi:TPP-dependent indolepyruvate ferredoxin oxidoreductase alpha subunit